MNRRDFLLTTTRAGIAAVTLTGVSLSLSGCGGGGQKDSDGATIRTSGNGRLSDVAISPEAGATFISRFDTLDISWPGGNPPAEFIVTLHRFLEPRGGENREDNTQKISAEQLDANRWRIRRRDNFNLEARGVYYLQLTAAGQAPERFAFIVDPSRNVTINPGTSGILEDVLITPRPGSVFLDRNQTFEIRWTGAFPPPSTFTVFLRRYKEARGDEDSSDREQGIVLNDRSSGSDFIWDMRRDNSQLLESNATYYIQINSGADTVRYTYIVGG